MATGVREKLKAKYWLTFCLSFVFVVVILPIAALFSQSGAGISDYRELLSEQVVWTVAFTIFQSAFSASLTLLFGLWVGLASLGLGRHGERFFSVLCQIPYALPSIAVAFAMVLTYGVSGYLNRALQLIGIPNFLSIYGFHGIVLANLFFNVPFAVLVFRQTLQQIPTELIRASILLHLKPRQVLTTLVFPQIWPVAKYLFFNTMVFCFFNFTLSLTLGGGPSRGTLEVLIYQAIHYDFRPDFAAKLCVLQMLLGLVLFFPFRKNIQKHLKQVSKGNNLIKSFTFSGKHRIFALTVFLIFLLLPLFAIVIDGIRGAFVTDFSAQFMNEVFQSAGVSLAIAGVASFLSVTFSMVLNFSLLKLGQNSKTSNRSRLLLFAAMLISPVSLSFAFLSMYGFESSTYKALFKIIAIHIALYLPYATLQLRPFVEDVVGKYQKVCDLLNLTGWHSFRLIYGPLLRSIVVRVAGTCFLFSLAEMGVVAIFSNDNISTIPLLIYRLMGAYRFSEAALLTFGFTVLSGIIFAVSTYLGQRKDTLA